MRRPARTLAALGAPTLAIALWGGYLQAQSASSLLLSPATVSPPVAPSEQLPSRVHRLPPVEDPAAYRVMERLPAVEAIPRSPMPPLSSPVISDVERGMGGSQVHLPAASPRGPSSPLLAPASPNDSPVMTGLKPPHPPEQGEIPAGFEPWWQPYAVRPLRTSPAPMPVSVESLIISALRYSARIQAISDNAIIAETAITRAAAVFDSHAFMESKMVRTSVPTGSTLEAGFNVPRLRESDWFYRAGARRRTSYGGKLEASQQVGLKDSNSQFFFPDDQGNSRLTLSFNQPLLNGAGKAYNNSLILLAKIDTSVAEDKTAGELQDHLLEVMETHWRLYEQRAISLQRKAHLERAETILERLDKRRDVDSLASQIARARAAVSTRRAGVIRSEGEVRNAEARLRAIVNAPEMLADRANELVPAQWPVATPITFDSRAAFLTALENRAEIDAATRELEAARVRLNMAQNELLPVLDLVLESYVTGLRGDNDIGRSMGDQFSRGEPSYTAGLLFEVPLDRRAAKSTHKRREAELRQLSSQFKAAVETLHSEVEVAVRDVDTTYRELQARYLAMVAAQADAQYLHLRWESLPGDDRAASFTLEDLLDAQDRLAYAESTFVESQVAHTLSLARLNRATGVMLKQERVQLIREEQPGAPVLRFERAELPR
jgi:outer membrane protein